MVDVDGFSFCGYLMMICEMERPSYVMLTISLSFSLFLSMCAQQPMLMLQWTGRHSRMCCCVCCPATSSFTQSATRSSVCVMYASSGCSHQQYGRKSPCVPQSVEVQVNDTFPQTWFLSVFTIKLQEFTHFDGSALLGVFFSVCLYIASLTKHPWSQTSVGL